MFSFRAFVSPQWKRQDIQWEMKPLSIKYDDAENHLTLIFSIVKHIWLYSPLFQLSKEVLFLYLSITSEVLFIDLQQEVFFAQKSIIVYGFCWKYTLLKQITQARLTSFMIMMLLCRSSLSQEGCHWFPTFRARPRPAYPAARKPPRGQASCGLQSPLRPSTPRCQRLAGTQRALRLGSLLPLQGHDAECAVEEVHFLGAKMFPESSHQPP